MEYRWRQTGLVRIAADFWCEEWIHRPAFRRQNQQPRSAASHGRLVSIDRLGISLQTFFIRACRDDVDLGPQQRFTWTRRATDFQRLHAGIYVKLRRSQLGLDTHRKYGPRPHHSLWRSDRDP